MGLAWGEPRVSCLSIYNFSPLAISVVVHALRYIMAISFIVIFAFLSLQFRKAPIAFEAFTQACIYTVWVFSLNCKFVKVPNMSSVESKLISILMHEILNNKNTTNWHYATPLQSVWDRMDEVWYRGKNSPPSIHSKICSSMHKYEKLGLIIRSDFSFTDKSDEGHFWELRGGWFFLGYFSYDFRKVYTRI